ncbi:MAG: putative glycolipid-binding domain-containing protein [Actinomycetota bacterium]|nr:putative glycolipid-binding domain-containing protein [Actinomycetota bacterium]
MLTWQAPDGRTLESARVIQGDGRSTGLRALGRSVRAAADGPAFTASYRLLVGESGAVQRVSVTSTSPERERSLTLSRTEDGYWLVDTCSGGSRAAFDGAVDVDLQYSPLFNTPPIRRLRLHREVGEHRLPMVFVALPTLEVSVVYQHYRTISPLGNGDPRDRAVVGFGQDDYAAEITVDGDGFVLDYPGLATRL